MNTNNQNDDHMPITKNFIELMLGDNFKFSLSLGSFCHEICNLD